MKHKDYEFITGRLMALATVMRIETISEQKRNK